MFRRTQVEHLNHRRNQVAPAGMEPRFRVTDYIACYSRCLDVCRYQGMLQQSDAIEFLGKPDREQETILSAWGKKSNQWGVHGGLEQRC